MSLIQGMIQSRHQMELSGEDQASRAAVKETITIKRLAKAGIQTWIMQNLLAHTGTITIKEAEQMDGEYTRMAISF